MNEPGTRPPLRIGRVIGYGLLAEVATVLLILATVTLYERVIAAGQPAEVRDAFLARLLAVMGPAAGVLFTFVAAVIVTRPLTTLFRLHGALVGVVTNVLTAPALLSASSATRPVYLGAILLKIGAGYAAGWLSERRVGPSAGSATTGSRLS